MDNITVFLPLNSIATQSGETLDLTALSVADAIEKVREIYSFLFPLPYDVRIAEGRAVVEIHASTLQEIDEAERLYNLGVKNAKRGRYKPAIDDFKKSLTLNPTNFLTRRDLGMAYLEAKLLEEAKTQFIDCLRLDPKDAWSYVLLANIYSKHEKDFATAEKFYLSALALKPDDTYALTNLGAMMMEKERYSDARKYFKLALEKDGRYPNAHYGLALAYWNEKIVAETIDALENLFEFARSDDPRSANVFQEARNMYVNACKVFVEKNYDSIMSHVDSMRIDVERMTGLRVIIMEDESLKSMYAKAEPAWRYGRQEHVIRWKQVLPEITPHLIAHELTHLIMEHEAREAGRNRLFETTPANRERAIRAFRSSIDGMKKKGFTDASIEEFISNLVKGLTNQLFNAPLDFVIETKLWDNHPQLRTSQFVSLFMTLKSYEQAITDTDMRKLSPPIAWNSNVAMNQAYAIYLDEMLLGRSNFAAAYEKIGLLSIANKLVDEATFINDNFKPGDEYDLVNRFASILHLDGYYELRGDDMPSPTPEGLSNPELLHAKEPAAVMYCLAAIQRFESMDIEDVRKITTEIALLGQEGIDYASADSRYSLCSLPGEKFSGLQLLSLMFVGFKQINPSLDTQIQLGDAYRVAMAIHKGESTSRN